MNKTTMGICLAALLVSYSMNSVLRADELVIQDDFFVADETKHQWMNEYNSRTGMLTVSGALLLSPCSLETNEVALPLSEQKEGLMTRYALKLNFEGCGDGGSVTSVNSVAGRDDMTVIQRVLLTGGENVVLLPDQRQRMIGTGRTVVHGGANQFTYWLGKAQLQALEKLRSTQNNAVLLSLQLDYE